MDFYPIGNKLLIQIKTSEKQTAGGIILPTEKLTKEAIVISTGPEVKDIVPGDTIMLEKLEGAEVKLEGKDYYIILEDNVIGVF